MESLKLTIAGMHCDGCAATAQALLEREPGVKQVSVSFADGEARILYDPAVTRPEQLIATVGRPGYRVVAREP